MIIHLFQGDVKFPLKQALRVQATFSSANGQALSAGWLVSDRYYVFARAQRRLHDMENRLHGVQAPPPAPGSLPPHSPPLPRTTIYGHYHFPRRTSLRNEDNV